MSKVKTLEFDHVNILTYKIKTLLSQKIGVGITKQSSHVKHVFKKIQTFCVSFVHYKVLKCYWNKNNIFSSFIYTCSDKGFA